ncbi:MAG: hypothetical protein J6O73_12650 [Lachnospiraceae bacterium]|nr:hypothetical protein [Lachnospiraceae bacterium]
MEDCKACRQVIEYFKKTNITYSDIYGSFGAKGSKQTAEGVRESFEQFPDLMAGWPGHKTEVREKIEETEQGNSENPTDYVEGVSETVTEMKQGDYSENGEIKSWKSSAEMTLDYIRSMRDKNNQLKADIEKLFKDYNKDDLKKNDVTDKNGNIIGYSISSKNGEKKYRVCEFDNEDNLIRIEDTGYIIDWDNCPESHTVLSIRFDKNGKIISWFTWDYLPEDGIGWDWYYTEYDESGKVIEDEYRGRI